MNDPHENADPGVRGLIARLEDRGTAPEALRGAFLDFVRQVEAGGTPRHDIAKIVDSTIAGKAGPVAVRIYTPEGAMGDACFVYFHGGGFVVGDLETADLGARALAAELRIKLISVHYRLAPEHPFPAPFDDCLSVIQSVAAEGVRSIYIGGESAGANLSAALAQACRDANIRLAGQFLINPLVEGILCTPSRNRLGHGDGLTLEAIDMFIRLYAGAADPNDPRISPLRAATLAGVAPAFVTTAECDPLLDDGILYAKRLIKAGVPTIYQPMPRMMHAWWALLTASPAARAHLDQMMSLARGFVGAYR